MRRALTARSSGSAPPWTIPNSACRSVAQRRARSAHRWVRSIATTTSSFEAGSAGQWSSTIWTSAPSCTWMATASSGVSRTRVPSYVEVNVTPSSSILGRSDMTW